MSVHLKAKEQGQCKAWSWSCNSYKSQSYNSYKIWSNNSYKKTGSNKPYKTQSHKDCVFVMNGMP